MPAFDSDVLVSLNDPRLARLILAPDAAVEEEIERLVIDVAQPLSRAIAARYTHSGGAIGPDRAADILGTINLRLVAKLRAVRESPEDAIRDLESYLATLAFNVVNDQFRETFPARARLKKSLRNVLANDPRLAIWTRNDSVVCGLAEWTGAAAAAPAVPLDPAGAGGALLDAGRPAEALLELFRLTGKPVAFREVVVFFARAWNVSDAHDSTSELQVVEARQAATVDHLAAREYLRAVWAEIRELRPMQRKALLLNLRGADAADVVPLFVLTGITPLDDLAGALEMTPDELADIWNELPFDDLRIAALLGVTRQQVINLRKSARERLYRRLSR